MISLWPRWRDVGSKVPTACRKKCRLPSVACKTLYKAASLHPLPPPRRQPCSDLPMPLHMLFPLPGMPYATSVVQISLALKLETQVPFLPCCLQTEVVVPSFVQLLVPPWTLLWQCNSLRMFASLNSLWTAEQAVSSCVYPSVLHSSQTLIVGAQ